MFSFLKVETFVFSTGEVSQRRVKVWSLCFDDLLADPLGREHLTKFLEKEYSGENLRFWWAVQELRKCSSRMVPILVTEIYKYGTVIFGVVRFISLML